MSMRKVRAFCTPSSQYKSHSKLFVFVHVLGLLFCLPAHDVRIACYSYANRLPAWASKSVALGASRNISSFFFSRQRQQLLSMVFREAYLLIGDYDGIFKQQVL